MSKINNVGLNLGQKIANPFKTSRNITTPNPFKYSNFEGNSLPFADVFDGFEQKQTSKLKMIASSVAGSMTKLRSSIPESVVHFAKRIADGFSNALTYFNKEIFVLPGEKAIKEFMQRDIKDIGKDISNSIVELGKNIKESIHKNSASEIEQVAEMKPTIGNSLSEKWNNLISKISLNNNKISKDTPVDELKAMWENEIRIALEKEAA